MATEENPQLGRLNSISRDLRIETSQAEIMRLRQNFKCEHAHRKRETGCRIITGILLIKILNNRICQEAPGRAPPDGYSMACACILGGILYSNSRLASGFFRLRSYYFFRI
jgi:hypothetical protein